ncbi:DUF1705 domain-containing protein [Gimesia benthica]|uniref:DUF1705 domain-containing protein n=1 Tax=Gimesia benthica TaxID=2608982 RepID=A0A6I6A7K4_9PLAN|nr:phosphoethanolamine transferase domain-containing protein [Gimesia benthica]QGQ22113.1 DUF1705 domain-containing protein [Gimesia benthica]
MLMKSNHETRSRQKIRRHTQGSFERLSASRITPYVETRATRMSRNVEETDTYRAESFMVIRLILILVLLGITPLVLFLLSLQLYPDLLHIEITP